MQAQEARALRLDFIDALKAHLGQALPDYMVPAVFVVLEQLPLTANGKVDRKGLPKPEMALQQQAYVAPRTETEQLLCELWQEVLGIERVGVTDNFFALGGHSLLATKLKVKIYEVFNVNLELRAFFAASTIEGNAVFIEAINLNKINSKNIINSDFEEGEF